VISCAVTLRVEVPVIIYIFIFGTAEFSLRWEERYNAGICTGNRDIKEEKPIATAPRALAFTQD
jgi:hypothetical protein